MSWGMIVVGAVSTGVGIFQSNKNRIAAEDQAEIARIERDKQKAALDIQKAEYKAMEFENPFANMENVYEDLTVNQQQAQFQAQQGQQQRANIMQGLRGAAGASGIAGLAQTMAGQGQLQTQRISASIGQQESLNQRLAAQGAGAVQIAERTGEQWVQQQEIGQQETLLGMQMGETSGANLAYQQAQANQMSADIAQQQAIQSGLGVLGQAAGIGTDFLASGRQANPNIDLSETSTSLSDFNDKLTSGIDPTNTTGMVQVKDNRPGSPTQGQLLTVPAADKFKY